MLFNFSSFLYPIQQFHDFYPHLYVASLINYNKLTLYFFMTKSKSYNNYKKIKELPSSYISTIYIRLRKVALLRWNYGFSYRLACKIYNLPLFLNSVTKRHCYFDFRFPYLIYTSSWKYNKSRGRVYIYIVI